MSVNRSLFCLPTDAYLCNLHIAVLNRLISGGKVNPICVTFSLTTKSNYLPGSFKKSKSVGSSVRAKSRSTGWHINGELGAKQSSEGILVASLLIIDSNRVGPAIKSLHPRASPAAARLRRVAVLHETGSREAECLKVG